MRCREICRCFLGQSARVGLSETRAATVAIVDPCPFRTTPERALVNSVAARRAYRCATADLRVYTIIIMAMAAPQTAALGGQVVFENTYIIGPDAHGKARAPSTGHARKRYNMCGTRQFILLNM